MNSKFSDFDAMRSYNQFYQSGTFHYPMRDFKRSNGVVVYWASFRHHFPSESNFKLSCGYCKQVNLPSVGHTKHNCAVLMNLAPCRICGATGYDNHTEIYCPYVPKVELALNPVWSRQLTHRQAIRRLSTETKSGTRTVTSSESGSADSGNSDEATSSRHSEEFLPEETSSDQSQFQSEESQPSPWRGSPPAVLNEPILPATAQRSLPLYKRTSLRNHV